MFEECVAWTYMLATVTASQYWNLDYTGTAWEFPGDLVAT